MCIEETYMSMHLMLVEITDATVAIFETSFLKKKIPCYTASLLKDSILNCILAPLSLHISFFSVSILCYFKKICIERVELLIKGIGAAERRAWTIAPGGKGLIELIVFPLPGKGSKFDECHSVGVQFLYVPSFFMLIF